MRLDPSGVPDGYGVCRVGRAWIVARAGALDFARNAVASVGSLFAYAETHPHRQVLKSGRGPLYTVPGPDGRWAVRRYRRGGWLARLGDRYLRAGLSRQLPRPLAELAASAGARTRGVPTPEIVAAAVYPGVITYRADLATLWIPNASDLAALLFGPRPLEGVERRRAWEAAGRLVRTLHARGLVHRDLNLKNILLETRTDPPRAHILDLDRCRLTNQVSAAQRARMLKRFRRSVEKWGRLTGRAADAAEWQAFDAGYRSGDG